MASQIQCLWVQVGDGIKAFQILDHAHGSACYHAIRKDNSVEDFSYLKCLMTLFPDDETLRAHKINRWGEKVTQWERTSGDRVGITDTRKAHFA